MTVDNTQVEAWHVLLFLGVVVVGIIKLDLVRWIENLLTLKRKRYPIGEMVEIQEVDGSWSPLVIRSYATPGLFGTRCGGIVVEHPAKSPDSRYHQEKISIQQWSQFRVR